MLSIFAIIRYCCALVAWPDTPSAAAKIHHVPIAGTELAAICGKAVLNIVGCYDIADRASKHKC